VRIGSWIIKPIVSTVASGSNCENVLMTELVEEIVLELIHLFADATIQVRVA
jgi:hypothetical protein